MGRDRRRMKSLLAGALLLLAVVCFGASCSRREGERERPAAPAEQVAPPSPVHKPAARTVQPKRRAPSTSVADRTREPKPAPAAQAGPSLFEKALELNMVLEPELDRARVREAFEAIVSRARKGLAGAALPRDKIKVLNRVLLTDREVSYLSNKYWRDGTLAASVLRRRGNCMSMSALYVLVASELGLPVWLVVIPQHAFVRWDDGRTRVNIETVAGGAEVSDEHYASRHPYTPEDKAVLGFGEPQDANGFEAELLLTAARHRYGENRLEEAVAYVDRALALRPRRLDIKLWRAQLRSDITSDRQRFRLEVRAMLRR
ncbi:MAG: transglutaminase family protein, partial [Planctomycetota bacterium]